MRKLFGLLCLVCAISCHEPLVESLPRFMREQGRTARREPGDTSARPAPTPGPPLQEYVPSVYATALHFRDSVNWRLDSLGAADVLFFKDGQLVLRQPVPSPPDPERHRIWDGRLWTDYTDGNETVLLCDGVERFRYPGEEQLRGFLIVDGDVHTLGQRPGNGGFSYRINGEAVFSRDRGSVLGSPSSRAWRGGALYQDEEDIYYSYRIGRDYHVMKGAETFRIIPAPSHTLYDLRVRGGHLWRAEKHASTLMLLCDEHEMSLSAVASDVLSCQLVPSGNQAAVLGKSRMSNGLYSFWQAPFDTGIPVIRSVGHSPKSELCYLDSDALLADVNPDGTLHQLLYNTVHLDVPAGVYTSPLPPALFLSRGHYAAALTQGGTGPHLLLHDGKEDFLSFNGYFTSVLIE